MKRCVGGDELKGLEKKKKCDRDVVVEHETEAKKKGKKGERWSEMERLKWNGH